MTCPSQSCSPLPPHSPLPRSPPLPPLPPSPSPPSPLSSLPWQVHLAERHARAKAALPNRPFSPTCHSPQPAILPNLSFSPTCHSPQPAILPNLSFSPTCHSPQPAILPNLPFSPTCHSPQPAILPNLPFSPTCHSPQPAILPNLPFSPTCHSPQPAILPNLPFSPTCHSPQPAILPNLPFSPTCPFSPAAFVPPTLPPPPSLPGRYIWWNDMPEPKLLKIMANSEHMQIHVNQWANQATLSFLASLLHVNSSCASLPASSRPSLTWTRPSNAPPSPRRRKRFDKTEGTGLFAREERETAERETAEAQTGEGGVGGSEGDALTNQEQPPHPWGCIPELPAVDWPKLRWRFDWSTFTIHATSDRKPLAVRAWTGRTASERRDFRFVLQRGSKGWQVRPVCAGHVIFPPHLLTSLPSSPTPSHQPIPPPQHGAHANGARHVCRQVRPVCAGHAILPAHRLAAQAPL
ncbi:unnamed protein product [Closterium sp. Naga37s-1]|nr:unnamed protein product [Closterium sp. Naga37s-1]